MMMSNVEKTFEGLMRVVEERKTNKEIRKKEGRRYNRRLCAAQQFQFS